MRWSDLEPDPAMVAALDAADRVIPRPAAIRGGREERHKWSNAFADACATMIANEFRKQKAFRNFKILPEPDGPKEPRTFVAGDKSKQVDVVVASPISGLQVGVSLKAMNFRDSAGWQFDKNLTGRTYELQDELRVIHEYQPAAFMVAMYFLPIAATVDKRSDNSASSFARTVEHLRARTGRLDRFLPSQLARADAAYVGIYVAADAETDDTGEPAYQDCWPRGVIRYFDVAMNPPIRGRPVIPQTLTLDEMCAQIIMKSMQGPLGVTSWGDPE